jgi:hypothetical protein
MIVYWMDLGISIWVIVISQGVMRRRLSRRYFTPFISFESEADG